MKKLLMTLLATMMLAACDNDPVFHGLTQQEKEAYAQGIKGEYPGQYAILYTDVHDPDGDGKMYRETFSDVSLSVSDLTMHTIIFNDFPLSLIARVVEDPELSQALSTLPNIGLTGNYEFKRAVEDGKVGWYFDLNPVALSLTYGGEQHNIVLHFSTPSGPVMLAKGQVESGTVFVQGLQLTIDLSGIYEGDQQLQLQQWLDGPELIVIFRFGL